MKQAMMNLVLNGVVHAGGRNAHSRRGAMAK